MSPRRIDWRPRLARTLALAGIAAALALGCLHLGPILKGNLALVACLAAYNSSNPDPAACAETETSDAQLAQSQERMGDVEAARRTLNQALFNHPQNQALRDALEKLSRTDQ